VISIYVNGTRIGNTSFSTSITGTNASIGLTQNNEHQFAGYIDDVRITKGNNREYTGSTITVPTAAFPTEGPMFAPTSLSATGGNAQVSLAWTAPSYNGGSAITDYSVQFSSDSGSTWTTFSRTASTTASQVVSSLTNGTAYVFRVAGINSNGTGTYTAASSSVTPIAVSVPGAPTGLSISGTSCGQGTVAWSAPASNGGSAITGYRIRISTDSYAAYRQVSGTAYAGNSTLVSGAPNIPSGSFTVRVSAVNSAGEGAYVAASATGDSTYFADCG
jgi:hypothetical protein